MKKYLMTSASFALIGSMASAGGLDRTGQFLGDLFAEGDVAKLSFGTVSPSVSGTGLFTGAEFSEVGNNFNQTSASVKMDITDALSFLVIYDEPFGVDVEYDGNPAATELAGTVAFVDSSAVTAVGRYKFGNGFSAHAGLRAQTIEGNITLSGLAYGTASGYNIETDSDTEFGYLVGVAYERPDIALRVALTYNSAIDYELDAVDEFPAASFLAGEHILETSTPESWNLEFQTGVAEDTLVFGSIRWAAWGDFDVPANALSLAAGSPVDLADIDDSTDFVIGVGRRFTDRFAGSVSIQYEAEGDELVSPLAPTNGRLGLTVGGSYKITDALTLAGGVNYTTVGDAMPETGTPDVARADFEDNDSIGVGFSLAYSF